MGNTCKICDWKQRLEFDAYFNAVKPSFRVAAQWLLDRGLDITHPTVRAHIPHIDTKLRSDEYVSNSKRQQIEQETIDKLTAEYGMTIDTSSVETTIETQQKILAEIVNVSGLKCLNEIKLSAENNTPFPVETAKGYSLVFALFARVTALDKFVDINSAAAVLAKHYGDARVIEGVVDV
jgi:hypothetical protein